MIATAERPLVPIKTHPQRMYDADRPTLERLCRHMGEAAPQVLSRALRHAEEDIARFRQRQLYERVTRGSGEVTRIK